MFKKKWYLAAKGSRNKKPTDNDQIGDFGTDISSAENEFTSRKQALPFLQHKGPNSVTFQLSGPQSFAVVGRNKKIREELNKLPGSRLDPDTGAYEFDLARKDGVKSRLEALGLEVNDIPEQVIRVMNEATNNKAKFQPVDMTLMPQLLVESLLPFQQIGVEFAIQRGGKALICDDMGLGKTIQGIAVAAYFMSEWPCLVLAQSSLKRVWSAEFEKWIPAVRGYMHVVESASDFKPAQVTIMAYDLAAKMVDTLEKCKFKVILADESHMLKSPTAQRTRALVPLLRKSRRTILLSGTPALSRPCELFPQLLALDASIFPTMKAFGIRYCNAHEGIHGWDYTGNSNLIELNALLTNTIMIRRLKDAVLSDLPPKVRKIVHIEKDYAPTSDPILSINGVSVSESCRLRLQGLSELDVDPWTMSHSEEDDDRKSEQKSKTPPSKPKALQAEDDDIFAMFREAALIKQEGVRRYIRKLVKEEDAAPSSTPQQIASFFGPDSIDDHEWHVTVKSTPTSSMTNCASTGRKFLIFAHHHSMMDAVEDELQSLKVPLIRIDGESTTKERALSVKQFQSDVSIRAAVLSMNCASTGLTLTSASLVIFAELYWNPGTLIQAEDRVHRLGQTAPFVELRYLFCKDTVDDVLWPLIGKKLGVVGTAINGVRDRMQLNGSPSSKSKITAINNKKIELPLELEEENSDLEVMEVTPPPPKAPRAKNAKSKASSSPQSTEKGDTRPKADKSLKQSTIDSFMSTPAKHAPTIKEAPNVADPPKMISPKSTREVPTTSSVPVTISKPAVRKPSLVHLPSFQTDVIVLDSSQESCDANLDMADTKKRHLDEIEELDMEFAPPHKKPLPMPKPSPMSGNITESSTTASYLVETPNCSNAPAMFQTSTPNNTSREGFSTPSSGGGGSQVKSWRRTQLSFLSPTAAKLDLKL